MVWEVNNKENTYTFHTEARGWVGDTPVSYLGYLWFSSRHWGRLS